MFHWSVVCRGWQLLWWGVISFQNFRSLKLRLYFCVDFLASSELIGYIDLMELAKMFLGYQCKKGCEAFLIFQIPFLLNALLCRRSANIQFANIQFANFKMNFLVNQSEYRKSLTPFCSPSATDWHCVVSLYLRSGRQVIQFNKYCQFCVLKACAHWPLNQILKKNYFFWFYILLASRWYILFYGYNISGAHMNDSLEDTPEGLQ